MELKKIFINLIPIKYIKKQQRYKLNNKSALHKIDSKLPTNILKELKIYENKYFYKINKTIHGGGGIRGILTLNLNQKIKTLP